MLQEPPNKQMSLEMSGQRIHWWKEDPVRRLLISDDTGPGWSGICEFTVAQ